MGQKVNPISLRLDLNRSQDNLWYSDSLHYGKILTQELQMRGYQERSILTSNFYQSRNFFEIRPKSSLLTSFFLIPDSNSISNWSSKDTSKQLKIHPGGTQKMELKINNRKTFLKQYISSKLISQNETHPTNSLELMRSPSLNKNTQNFFLTKNEKNGNLRFIRLSDSDLFSSAHFVAIDLAKKLESRQSWRDCIKGIERNLQKLKEKSNIRGLKIQCSGRIGGVEMAQRESSSYGQTSLQTFAARVDYAQVDAHTPSGILGIQVWLCYD